MKTMIRLSSGDCSLSLVGCFILSVTYVMSLYVWTTANSHRDHPTTVKRRILSVMVMALISPLFVVFFTYCGSFNVHSLWELLGLRAAGFFMASTVPLLLTMILFLGPLTIQRQNCKNDSKIVKAGAMCWIDNLTNLLWIRDHIVAPLSEEITFRACMLPLLVQCFRPQGAVLISPIFFGIAHVHHIVGRLNSGLDMKKALLLSGFQVLYTTLFGAYSAYLFLRTGHFIAPFLAHAFCNHMGFPDFSEVLTYSEPKRTLTFSICVFGLIVWCILLTPLTNPVLYSNTIYWDT